MSDDPSDPGDLLDPPASGGGLRLLSIVALVWAVLAGVYVLQYAVRSYDALPEQIPVHFDGSGNPDRYTEKSPAGVYVLPVTTLLAGLMTALLAIGLSSTKLTRHSGGSHVARLRSRWMTGGFLSGLSILVTTMLAVISGGALDVSLGTRTQLPGIALWLGIGVGVYAVGGVIYMAATGGLARNKSGGEAAASDDASRWLWGLFYYAPEDPAMFVEKRMGLGYTLNFGNKLAIVMTVVFVAAFGGILALAFMSS